MGLKLADLEMKNLAWTKYHFTPVLENQEEILFAKIQGNSLIRRRNQPIFNRKLSEAGIDYIMNIFSMEKKSFVSYEELERKQAFEY